MKICPVCAREFPPEHTLCPQDGIQLVELATGAGGRPEELVGQVVDGRYRVERIVGKGGMGTVYAVRHVVVGKSAAMKVLRQGVERSEGVLQRFIREAQTANALRSRHIAEISDFGQLPNGCFFVVMELLEGHDLTHAMRKGQLSFLELVHVFVQVAETLDHAHALGIVHRDLKPDNVFLVTEGDDPNFVKLLDFGIAKVLDDRVSGLTETGVILGTPYYMAPEQARAEAIDHRVDIYALGVMMYRAFTGKLPFIADSMMGVLTRHLTEAPALPSSITAVDPGVERVILRCLEKLPANRFQSMQEVAATLRLLVSHPGRPVRDEPTVPEGGRGAAAAPSSTPSSSGRLELSGMHGPPPAPRLPAQLSYGAAPHGPSPSGSYGPVSPSGSYGPVSPSGAQPPPSGPSGAYGAMPGPSAPLRGAGHPPPGAQSGAALTSGPLVVPGAEFGTSRAFATSRGLGTSRAPPAMLVGGAVTLLGVGAALAVGVFLYGAHAAAPALSPSAAAQPTASTAPPASAPSAPPSVSAASPAAATATVASLSAPAASAPASATSAPASATSAPAEASRPRGGGARQPPAPPPPVKRPSTNEIRSPFE